MTTTLTYGKATTCQLDTVEATCLRAPSTEFLAGDRIAAEVRAQLANPMGFPPLAQSTVPGDCVVLAIAPEIPQQLHVIDGALQALRDAGVEDALITILLACPSTNIETLQTELAALSHRSCKFRVHQPEDEKEIALLGVSKSGQALRLNRALCDADLVLPLSVSAGNLSPSATSPSFAGLFPLFSDRETRERFSSATTEHFPALNPESLLEIEECGLQLGVLLSGQVVPAPGGQVAAFLAGDPATVALQAEKTYREIWCSESQVRGNLVIATLAGGADQQTWHNLGRALAAAEGVLEPGGCLVICSELAEPPGVALSQLFGNEEYQVIQRAIQQNPGPDSHPAMQLCQALQRGTVYLRSQLNPSVAESLGFMPLESDGELEHLAQTLRPCIVLEEAQRLLPSLAEVEA